MKSKPHRPANRFCRLRSVALAAAALCAWVGVGRGFAQETPAPSPTPAAAAEPMGALTLDAVEARLTAVGENAELPEAMRKRLVDLYEQVRAQLRAAREWKQKAEEFEALRQSAPERLAEIRKELARAPEEPEPDVPPEAPLPELEQLLNRAQTELEAARNRLTELEGELSRRNVRRREIPELQKAAKARLVEIDRELTTLEAAEADPRIVEARRHLAQARRRAAENEIDAYEKELLSYEARTELLTVRRDLAAREVAQAEKLVQAWQKIVQRKRSEATAEALREARQRLQRYADMHPALRQLAEENVALVERRVGSEGVAARINQAGRELERIGERLAQIETDFQNMRGKVETIGLNKALGLLLRRQRDELPPAGSHQRNIRARQETIAEIQYEILVLEERRSDLADLEARAAQFMNGLEAQPAQAERERLLAEARELFAQRRQHLDELIREYNTWFVRLVDLDARERELLAETRAYREFIDEHVLWMESAAALGPGDARRTLNALVWLFQYENWLDLIKALYADLKSAPLIDLLLTAFLIGLFAARRRSLKRIDEHGSEVVHKVVDSFLPTGWTALHTLTPALFWPLLFGAVAWRLDAAPSATDFPRALAGGLRTAALLTLSLEIPRYAIRGGGLCEAHFGWPASALKFVRLHLWWLRLIAIPALSLTAILTHQPEEAHRDSLGRLAFIVGMGGGALFAFSILHPRRRLANELASRRPGGWFDRFRLLWFVLGVGAPIALAVIAVPGFFYTAVQLAWRVYATVCVAVGLAIAAGLFNRWLFLLRRRLAVKQARQRRKARRRKAEESGQADEIPKIDEEEIDVSKINVQVERLLRSFFAVVFIVGMWAIWADVLPALNFLNEISLWSQTKEIAETAPTGEPTGRTVQTVDAVTLGNLLMAVFILILTTILGRNIPGLLEIGILQRLNIGRGECYAIITLTRYAIVVVGVILAFGAINIGWGKVQWLIAAMGVGLGFGLQEIFANFVSGLIILFERPIRAGDTVTVGDTLGTVSQIRIRSTTIIDWDRHELIVPNKEFITSRVLNWSLSDPISRLVIPVGIAYGSDTELAHKLLLRVAHESPYVLDEPPPTAIFREFGDSALIFNLRIFIPDMSTWGDVMHQIHTAIDQAFREAGIEIAFPQRDIHVRTIRANFPPSETPKTNETNKDDQDAQDKTD